MKKTLLLVLGLILFFNSFSQTVQREFRASWVATVSNLDWPKSMDAVTQKQELITILDGLEEMNMNAIFLQVRPYSDAFYNSAYEPWSAYITGTRGKNPGYDPLQFALEEAHKRGIEVHAWMNPYRASYYSASDCVGAQASWFLSVEGKTYYNPGLPEVTTYITNVVADLVNNYEIDGVVFDDYFYPDKTNEYPDIDKTAFETYGNGRTLGDFRRESVNAMVAAVNTTIKTIKPDMRFGIAPFGIYNNTIAATSHGTTPSAGQYAWDTYSEIYCDPLAWLEEGSIDYLSPQLYWSIDQNDYSYDVLTEWWGKECKRYGKHCYPSLGVYRYTGKSKSTLDPELHENKLYFEDAIKASKGYSLQEFVDEININRDNEINNVFGTVLYRNQNIFDTNLDVFLKQNVFQQKAIYQELSWLTSNAPTEPSNVQIVQPEGEPIAKLTWTGSDERYAVFGISTITKSAPVLLKMVFTEEFSLVNVGDFSEFAVAGISGKGKLSNLSGTTQLQMPDVPVLTSPIDKTISSTENFSWNYTTNATSYTINIYEDEALNSLIFAQSEISGNTFSFTGTVLEGLTNYFWEIVASNAVGTTKSQSANFYTGFPAKAEIVKPSNNQTMVSYSEGAFKWKFQAEATNYQIQLARNAEFTSNYIVLEASSQVDSLVYSNLLADTDYFVRVYSENAFGKGKWSETIKFRTSPQLPDAPVITSPTEAQFIDDTKATISWTKVEIATAYQLQISNDPNFSTLIYNEQFNAYTRSFEYTILYGKKYYVRVATKFNTVQSAWSSVLYFTNVTPSGIENALEHNIKIYPNPANEKINIEFIEENNVKSIEIYNITGNLVLKNNELHKFNVITLNQLNSGIYQLIINNKDNSRWGFRFVKN